jgi:hypothetical protein
MPHCLTNGESSYGVLAERAGDDVIEIPLLLQGWQITALEQAAQLRGQTAGEMVRNILRDFLGSAGSDLASGPQAVH